MAERKRVLVVGGSGYLGQHLLDGLATADGERPYDLAFTHHRPIPPPKLVDAISPIIPFRVDLCTGEGFESISNTFGKPHVVVNCAALSVPRACEADPAAAMATNLPTSLVNWLSSFRDNNILLIHISTDQVYEGAISFYKEEDETAPVNMYGKSKVAAEQFISAHCSNFAILRSSIIYGPQTISPVTKSLPIQWIDSSLSHGEEVEFFHDEFRCPVYVKDVVTVILALTKRWILDGDIPSIKLSTYRRRLGSVSEISHDDKSSQAITSLRRNMGSEFSCMIKEAKVLGLALGIPFIDGIEEAEAQCALLNSESLCDGCFTSDSDIFLFGARTVYREIFLGDGGYVICYEMADIEKKLGFGRDSLITLALLLGSDYSQRVYGFGRETACQLVKSLGDSNILQRVKSEGFAFAKKTAKSRKTVKSLNCNADKENLICYRQHMSENEKKLEPKDHMLQIINAYLKPKCHLPDSEAVQSACTTYPFLRARLQQICSVSFGWTPEKADEYILPKIAERDLRRFANLRNTSSELGENIPLHKMPVPCPVTAVVKQRTLQGRECFEVSWQDMDGLQTSVVSADLIESACPEKVAEFMEKKTMGKKKNTRKQRPKKNTNVDLKKVDFQLQGLLLDIESDSSSLPRSSQFNAAASLNGTGTEIIDLSSPSPPLRACKIAKPQQTINLQMNMINLCESPEHERKARELRLFIENIRGDL